MKFSSIPTYELILPSSGKKIKYRPFLVKEEKVLLLAIQEKNEDHVVQSLKNMIDACTFGELSVDKLPSVDIEYLFLMIRNKSMGEGLDLEVTCSKCEKKTIVSCNLDNITVTKTNPDKTVKLADDLIVTMRYPTLEMSYNISDDDIQRTIELMAKCIEFIEYKGKLHDASELPFEEIIEFVENMTQLQLSKLDEFLEMIPQVSFEDDYTCLHCGTVNHIQIRGLSDFFG